MQESLSEAIKSYQSRKRARSIFRYVFRIVSCIVAFATTYALILPAITMEQVNFCGLEEHVHTESCCLRYEEHSVLTCDSWMLSIHTHSEGCYDADGHVICGQADYLVHHHDESCRDTQGTLVCTLPERSPHIHGEDCYRQAEPVYHVHSADCYVPVKGELLCLEEVSEGHTHKSDCYQPGTELKCTKATGHQHGEACYIYPLVCSLSTEPHVHVSGCYIPGDRICNIQENHVHTDACHYREQVCGNEEPDHVHGPECYVTQTVCTVPEGHVHGENCYEKQLNCGKAAGEVHCHTTGCYSTERKLTCSLEENHEHTAACYKQELTCGLPESEGHSHEHDCYSWTTDLGCGFEEGQQENPDAAPVLVCTEPVALEHVHGEGCFEITVAEAEPVCGLEHEHTFSCYPLGCALEEHTHTLQCGSDPEADVENTQVWEATLQHVVLSGDAYQNVVAIAESQLGYMESSRNYEVWEDNSIHGYTRYGAWYGVPYGDWCGMFASFCLRYAGINHIPVNYGVRSWIEDLSKLGLYRTAAEAQPKPGCLVFFDWDTDGLSDHVGIVAEVTEASEHMGAEIKTIEGNSQNTVRYVRYAMKSPELLGYGFLTSEDAWPAEIETNPEESRDPLLEILICGTPAHSHEESCYDAEGLLLCRIQEHIHTMDCVDASSPVGNAYRSERMRVMFAMRREGTITYYDDIAPLLSGIVILGANDELVYRNGENGPEGTGQVTLGDDYSVELTFTERNTEQFDTGQLRYTIPSFLVTDNVSNGVIQNQGVVVATYTIIGNQLVVTPVGTENFFEIHNDARFNITFDAEAVFDSEHTELHIDFNDNFKIDIQTNQNGTLNTQKELLDYDPLTRTLTYRCVTTAHGGKVKLAVVADNWWANGVADGNVMVDRNTITLKNNEGEDVTAQWIIVISERCDIWMAPYSDYYLDHGETITLEYQVRLSDQLTENFDYQNTYYNYGYFNEQPIEITSVITTPITFTNIEKSGAYVAEEVNGIWMDALEWTVKVANPDQQQIVVTDELGANQTFCTHAPLLVKGRRTVGEASEHIEIPWSEITVNDDNTEFVLTLPKDYVEYELIYRSHYQLDPNDSGIQNFENTITTNITIGDEFTSGSAQVGVMGVPPSIDKQITSSDDQWLTFTVDCFMPAALNGQGSILLYDTLASWGSPDGFVSNIPDSLTVTITPVEGEAYQLQPYAGGDTNNTYQMVYDGQSFTMFFNTDQAISATSVWNCPVDSTLTISYRVSLDAPMLDKWGGTPTEETLRQFLARTGQGVDNTAQLNYSPEDSISDGVRYTPSKDPIPPLNKTGTPVTGEDGVYEYSVWFSSGEGTQSIFPQGMEGENHINLVEGLTLTDEFDSRMEYVEDSLEVNLWSYWNHKELVLSYSPTSGAPAVQELGNGTTRITISASDLIGLEGSDWLTGQSLAYALKYLPAGYQYEFTYRLRVKDEVKTTATEGILYLDNRAVVDWMEGTEPKSVGPANAQVTYNTGILNKTMDHPDPDSNLVHFSVLVNHNALDLAPNSLTYILQDTMSANLTLIYSSLKIELLDANGTLTAERTPEQCGFAYNPDQNRMTFTLPDSQVIRLSYNCRVNGIGGDLVDVGNTVELEGYSSIQDVVNAKFEVRKHIGNADASSKFFYLQKQDAYSFRVLPGVSFALYGETAREESKTITAGGKTLYYYDTFTTGENGMVQIAESQLSAGYLYALKEIAPLAGYLPQEEPYLFYMEHPPTGVTTDIGSVAEGALVVIQNVPVSYELPETGGAGTDPYTVGGVLLSTAALTLLYYHKKRRREETDSS